MRYVSLFSGIEAASCAWDGLGWEAVAFSEIEPFPCEVLAQRYPDVPNLGDIERIDWSDFIGKHGEVDLVVGGSPCQSFSVAGKREGLSGASGLMWEYIRAVRELRPRWLVWENVPGALSSEGGEAFRQLLSELDGLGYGLAWRVLDAQFFGVAQRRRRVFLVGSLGDVRSAEVLFEPEGLRWDNPPSRAKREELARAAGGGAAEGGGVGDCLTPWDCQSKQVFAPEGCAPTLCAGSGGKHIVPTVCFGMACMASAAPCSEELHPTLSASRHDASACYCIQGDIARGAHMGQNGCGFSDTGEAYTLNTMDVHAVAFPVACMADDNAKCAVDEGLCGSLKVGGSAPIIGGDGSGYTVRRLTPLECERLQGFPDGWTDVEFKGKHASDTARYKALGNSMAVPVMRWIGERIGMMESKGRMMHMGGME